MVNKSLKLIRYNARVTNVNIPSNSILYHPPCDLIKQFRKLLDTQKEVMFLKVPFCLVLNK